MAMACSWVRAVGSWLRAVGVGSMWAVGVGWCVRVPGVDPVAVAAGAWMPGAAPVVDRVGVVGSAGMGGAVAPWSALAPPGVVAVTIAIVQAGRAVMAPVAFAVKAPVAVAMKAPVAVAMKALVTVAVKAFVTVAVHPTVLVGEPVTPVTLVGA